MPDPAAPIPTTPDDAPFSAYLREENAKEQREARGEIDPVEPVAPRAAEATTGGGSGDVASEAHTPEASPAELVAVESDDTRNADGTFKGKARKGVTNTGEWVRNQQLTAKLREREAELEQYRSQSTPATPAAASAPAGSPWTDPNDPEPTIDRYLDAPDPYGKLAVEAAKWAVRDGKREAAFQQFHVERQHAQQETNARVQAFVAAHPDYHEIVNAIDDVIFAPDVLRAIAEDDDGPAVAYHLAQHPDEARRIAALTPVAGVKEIGKLLSRVVAAPSGSVTPTPSTSKAKPLIKPVSASPVASEHSPPDPDKTPFAQWVQLENAADRRRQREMRGA